MMRVILASKSPRRREILQTLGVRFEVVSADADETSSITAPVNLVCELALRKGRATRDLLRARGEWNDDTVVIAADTVVAVDGKILGKPHSDAEAAEMLRLLAGRDHFVVSGAALFAGDKYAVTFDKTAVSFAPMTENEIDRYVQSGEPRDKAGAYAVQGLASLWIRGLTGDYFNVVGLPVFRLNALCKDLLGRSLLDL